MKSIEKTDIKRRQRLLLIVCSVLIFLVIAVYTIIWEIDYECKYGYFKKTTATVVGYYEENGIIYDEFEYNISQNVVYKKTGSWKSKYDKGDTFYIYYDVNNPLGVIYSLDYKRIALPIVSGLMLLVNAGLIVLFILDERKQKIVNSNSDAKNIVQIPNTNLNNSETNGDTNSIMQTIVNFEDEAKNQTSIKVKNNSLSKKDNNVEKNVDTKSHSVSNSKKANQTMKITNNSNDNNKKKNKNISIKRKTKSTSNK